MVSAEARGALLSLKADMIDGIENPPITKPKIRAKSVSIVVHLIK
jgi:hypothetical protein